MEITGNKYSRSDWRRFLSTRKGTAVLAGTCALIAAAILIFAMARYRHSVNAEGNPETVFVASGEIQKGTSGDAIASGQLFKPTSIPRSFKATESPCATCPTRFGAPTATWAAG